MVSVLVKKLLWLSFLMAIGYWFFWGLWNQYITQALGSLGMFAGFVSLFAFLFVAFWILSKSKVASLPK